MSAKARTIRESLETLSELAMRPQELRLKALRLLKEHPEMHLRGPFKRWPTFWVALCALCNGGIGLDDGVSMVAGGATRRHD